jgi:hypothetical protein
MTPEQEKALHDALDRRAGQLATLKRSRTHRIMMPQPVGDMTGWGLKLAEQINLGPRSAAVGKCAWSLLLSYHPLDRYTRLWVLLVHARDLFVCAKHAGGTLHQPTSDNSRSGDPHQIRQRIRDDGRDRALDGGRQEVQPLRPSGRNYDPDWLPPRLAGVRVVRSAMVAG